MKHGRSINCLMLTVLLLNKKHSIPHLKINVAYGLIQIYK